MLYVSWCGQSVRDNSTQPPSVLVSQLRDYVSAGWGKQVVTHRTTQHPLQPFSRRYFEVGSPLLTYAREWCAAHEAGAVPNNTETLAAFAPDPNVPLTLGQLTQFLRNPVKAFFKQRLLVVFEQEEDENADEECFSVNGLDEYKLIQTLLNSATSQSDAALEQSSATRSLTQLRKAGALPLKGFGDLKQQELEATLSTLLTAWQTQQARFPDAAERQPVSLKEQDVALEDWIDHLRQGCAGDELTTAWLELQPSKLLEKSEKKSTARPEKLLGPWVRSLAVAASGLSARGVLVGRDSVVEIGPVSQADAHTMLAKLLTLWRQGMGEPLPLPPKTALTWLSDPRKAASEYEGDYMKTGEIEEPCLARMFPDFEALTADGRFEALAKEIYQPLIDWCKKHVTAQRHDHLESAT